MNLLQCRSQLYAASAKMADTVNTAFPVGCQVEIRWGRGGKFCAEVESMVRPFPGQCEEVGIRSVRGGKMHWKRFADLRRL